MEFYLQKFKRTVSYICLCIFVLIFLGQCSKDQDKESFEENASIRAKISSIIVNKETERFIALEDSFAGEYLYLPIKMLQHHITKEILILDQGNHCLYFFDENRKYIRKIGTAGQGPGDLLKPINMQIDTNGDIYIYEEGNSRISVFNSKGKFLTSFRIAYHYFLKEESYFAVKEDHKLVFNAPFRKHYITIFDKEQNAEDIGPIKIYDDIERSKEESESLIRNFSKGIPLIDDSGNFVLFLFHLPVVMLFNKYGEKILEKDLGNILEITDYQNPAKKSYRKGSKSYFYSDIIKNNRYYFILKGWWKRSEDNVPVTDLIKLDSEFNLVEKFHLIFLEGVKRANRETPWNICVYNEGKNILLAMPEESEILKFSIK